MRNASQATELIHLPGGADEHKEEESKAFPLGRKCLSFLGFDKTSEIQAAALMAVASNRHLDVRTGYGAHSTERMS